jgi:DNA-binding PadR family transcriptional regulator
MMEIDVLQFLATTDGHINDHLTRATLYGSDSGNPRMAEQEVDYQLFVQLKTEGLISSDDLRMPPKDHYKLTDKGRAKISS